MTKESAFHHPFDTPVSSLLRFLAELIAWVAGGWVAAQVSIWLAIPVLVVLVGLPAVFSTRGDKKQIVVDTPGPIRALLEIALHVVAVVCAWAVWPTWLAIVSTLIVAAAVAFGIPRTRWLLRGAPSASG